MHRIQRIQDYNKSELEKCVAPEASWHRDYKDTAYIYIGGLPLDLSEGDIITMFSQYGEPVWFKLARDKETGKSRGFGWLKYEDQRSCDLAVDNLGGASFMGRMLNVDHARYKPREDENMAEFNVAPMKVANGEEEAESEVEEKPLLKEERELLELLKDVEGEGEDDPMRAYMIEQKQKEVDKAREKLGKREGKDRRHRHRRSRKEDLDEDRHRDRRRGDRGEREKDSGDDGDGDGRHRSRREREQDSGEDRHRGRRRNGRGENEDDSGENKPRDRHNQDHRQRANDSAEDKQRDRRHRNGMDREYDSEEYRHGNRQRQDRNEENGDSDRERNHRSHRPRRQDDSSNGAYRRRPRHRDRSDDNDTDHEARKRQRRDKERSYSRERRMRDRPRSRERR